MTDKTPSSTEALATTTTDSRRAPRHQQHLLVNCRLSGPHGLPTGPRIPAEVLDLSPEGMAVRLGSAARPVTSESLQGQQLHLELRIPNDPTIVTTVAEVRWSRTEPQDGPGTARAGVLFLIGGAELAETFQQLINTGKGEKQFLWNLWETYSKAA
jgi:hypothetical protein